jgi:hypothetical protein
MSNGDWIMTEALRTVTIRRNRLPEAVQQELAKFEQAENEFCRKDREERARELRLPLNEVKVH